MIGNGANGTHNLISSTDQCQTWNYNSNSGIPAGYKLLSLCKDDNGTVYAGGSRSDVNLTESPVILKSTDNGLSWTEVMATGLNQGNSIVSMTARSGKIYAAIYGAFQTKIMSSVNGGSNWTETGSGVPSSVIVSDMASAQDGKIYLCGADNGNVFYSSSDQGNSWNKISTTGAEAMSIVNTILPNGQSVLCAGVSVNQSYVFSSQQQPSFLSEVQVQSFGVVPNPAGDQVTLLGSESELNTITDIEIISLIGQVVSHKTENFRTIDLQGLAKGLYYVTVNTENKSYVIPLMKN